MFSTKIMHVSGLEKLLEDEHAERKGIEQFP